MRSPDELAKEIRPSQISSPSHIVFGVVVDSSGALVSVVQVSTAEK